MTDNRTAETEARARKMFEAGRTVTEMSRTGLLPVGDLMRLRQSWLRERSEQMRLRADKIGRKGNG